MQYGELYHKNYYREVKDKNRVYYEFYHLDGTENVPEDYKEISFVCLRPDGSLELPSTLGIVCRKIAQKLDGFEGFHFHQLRHTYTSNLLANEKKKTKKEGGKGAPPPRPPTRASPRTLNKNPTGESKGYL